MSDKKSTLCNFSPCCSPKRGKSCDFKHKISFQAFHEKGTTFTETYKEYLQGFDNDFNSFIRLCDETNDGDCSTSKEYIIYNCYDKRNIDWLRNFTDVSASALQLLIKRLYHEKKDAFVGQKTFDNKTVLGVYSRECWNDFVNSNSWNDLNIQLRLIEKNTSSDSYITLEHNYFKKLNKICQDLTWMKDMGEDQEKLQEQRRERC